MDSDLPSDPDERDNPESGGEGQDSRTDHDDLIHEVGRRIEQAAVEAELETGRREPTAAAARTNIAFRLARITLGFLVVVVGIILLPLPGPGWVVIAGGFVILSRDFEWADRTVRLIRRRVPGVPEDGRIPTSSKIMIAAVTVGAGLIAFLFGDSISSFFSDLIGW